MQQDDDDREDPFDTDTDESDDDFQPADREVKPELIATQKANQLIQAELAYQEANDTDIINEELARSGADPLPQVDQSALVETMHGEQALDVPVENHDLEEYVGD